MFWLFLSWLDSGPVRIFFSGLSVFVDRGVGVCAGRKRGYLMSSGSRLGLGFRTRRKGPSVERPDC